MPYGLGMDFVVFFLVPWLVVGFLGHLWRAAIRKKEGRGMHPAQIYIDLAFGLFTPFAVLRTEV